MSHSRRGGRFAATTASEAYQRQLSQPVHKWRKAWVAPTGLQPEASYKIFKWVRIDQATEDDDEGDEDEEGDDDENEGNDDEGEVEEGDEEVEDEGENEAEGEINGAEAKPKVAMTGAVGPVAAAEGIDGTAMDVDPTPAGISVEVTGPTTDIGALQPESPSGAGLVKSPAPTLPISPADNTAKSDSAPSAPHEMPSNAIEISNTAPHSTELGQGDFGEHGGIEIKHPEPKSPEKADQPVVPSAQGSQTDIVMDSTGNASEDAAPSTGDDGLVMADHEPERDFAITGADEPREIEKEGE